MTTQVINERSTKDEIITSSLEMIDSQTNELDELRLQRRYLIAAVVALVVLLQF